MRISIISIAVCSRVTSMELLPDASLRIPHAQPLDCRRCVLPTPDGLLLMSGVMTSQSEPRKRVGKARTAEIPVAYRLAVASRIIAAVFGGYLVGALTSICITQWLPLPRADAVVTGMMLSFIAYLLAVIWCFACRSAWHAWCGIVLPAAVLALIFALGRWLA